MNADSERSSSVLQMPAPVSVTGQASPPDFEPYRQEVLQALPRQPSAGLETSFVETAAMAGFVAELTAREVADTLVRSGLLPERRGAK